MGAPYEGNSAVLSLVRYKECRAWPIFIYLFEVTYCFKMGDPWTYRTAILVKFKSHALVHSPDGASGEGTSSD